MGLFKRQKQEQKYELQLLQYVLDGCPFCNYVAAVERVFVEGQQQYFTIVCTNWPDCIASNRSEFAWNTLKEAIENWNRRAAGD